MKKIIAVLATLAVVITFALGSMLVTANANDDNTPAPCDQPTITVVDSEAWDETVTVVDEPAWTETIEGTPEIWANFAPTKPKTFVGPPAWPNDLRGKWMVHNKIPGGHEGPDGVYSKGNPHKGGNWFYRQAGTEDTVIEHPAVTHDEVIHHPAVTHEEPNPNYPCDPTDPVIPTEPVDPTTPVEPNEPKDETDKPKKPDNHIGTAVRAFIERTCEYNIHHEQEYTNGKWVDTKVEYVATGRDCSKSGEEPIKEEGL